MQRIPTGSYVDVSEAAQIKNVSRPTIQNWIKQGWLKSIFIGGAHLLRLDEVERFEPPRPGPKERITPATPLKPGE